MAFRTRPLSQAFSGSFIYHPKASLSFWPNLPHRQKKHSPVHDQNSYGWHQFLTCSGPSPSMLLGSSSIHLQSWDPRPRLPAGWTSASSGNLHAPGCPCGSGQRTSLREFSQAPMSVSTLAWRPLGKDTPRSKPTYVSDSGQLQAKAWCCQPYLCPVCDRCVHSKAAVIQFTEGTYDKTNPGFPLPVTIIRGAQMKASPFMGRTLVPACWLLPRVDSASPSSRCSRHGQHLYSQHAIANSSPMSSWST